jgi:hypothetical protein
MHPDDQLPLTLSRISMPGRTLSFRKPLTLIPTVDDSGQLLCLEHPPLGIHVFAESRDELQRALEDELDLLWRNYALVSDLTTLTPAAAELGVRLRAAIDDGNDYTG